MNQSRDPWPYPGMDDTERARHVARVLMSVLDEPNATMLANAAARYGQGWLAAERLDPWRPSWWRRALLRMAMWGAW